MTPAEVIEEAFTRDIEEEKITEKAIEAAQVKHLLPVLGEDFYNEIDGNLGSYAALLTKIEPCLAYIVKYYTLPKIFTEVSTTGLAMVAGKNNQKVGRDELADQQKAALDDYDLHLAVLRKYLDDNQDSFSLYNPSSDPLNQVEHIGGIVATKRDYNDTFYCEEDK